MPRTNYLAGGLGKIVKEHLAHGAYEELDLECLAHGFYKELDPERLADA